MLGEARNQCRQSIVCVSLLTALIGCGDSAAPAADRFTEGAYALESIGGKSLPYLVYTQADGKTATVLQDTLAFVAGQMFEVPVWRYERPGLPDSLYVAPRENSVPYRMSHDTLFIAFENKPDTVIYRARHLYAVTSIPPAGCTEPCQLIYVKAP